MRQGVDLLVLTANAAGAIVANRFVTVAGAQAGADANTLGVARTAAAQGDDFAVTVLGTEVVEAGGAIAVGDPVSSDANGKAAKTDGTVLTQVVARALEAAAAAGDFIEVLLIAN